MAQTLLRRYKERLQVIFDRGKSCGELDTDLDAEAASMLFIGAIQGLVVESLIAGDVNRMRHDAPQVFALYQRGIRRNA